MYFKPAPRLEQIGDKCSKQVDDRKHRIGWSDSPLQRESYRIEFSGTTILLTVPVYLGSLLNSC
jgi:hypothetical protein